MTIKAGLVTSLYSHDIFCCILVDYQTGLWEKYLVTEDWSQSTNLRTVPYEEGNRRTW